MADFIFTVTLTAQPSFNPIPPGLFEGGSPWGWGGVGGGRKCPQPTGNSKTINDNEMKFGEVVKDH